MGPCASPVTPRARDAADDLYADVDATEPFDYQLR
jgi:hypothetical protein